MPVDRTEGARPEGNDEAKSIAELCTAFNVPVRRAFAVQVLLRVIVD